MKKIFIGGALPYANGSLHIGHIASLLPGDILARYHRQKGDKVIYVSGSDCYGTPITIKAKIEGVTPEEISDRYHNEFARVFNKLGFSYDSYIKTTDNAHRDFVKKFHEKLYNSQYIFEKTAPQAYCPVCRKVLTDRQVTGKCPKCGDKSRGDQCDSCGFVPEAEQLKDPICSECGSKIEFKDSKHLYIALTKLKEELQSLTDSNNGWRKNAVTFTNRYINEGLRDRAITRDLEWGIDVPKTGYENKKIYIWAENVLAYISGSIFPIKEQGLEFDYIWKSRTDTKHYYIHGKDNIPFHTIILPALLLAHGEKWHLPDSIISSEHITLEGKRISTSNNWAVWAKELVEKYNPDSIRYFFIANGAEKRDTDFSWHEFTERNNNELLGIYGNLVNRTLVFIKKYYDRRLPAGTIEENVKNTIEGVFPTAGKLTESGNFREALENIFDLARFGNKYYDEKTPWKTRTAAPDDCTNTLFNCIQIIYNLAVLLHPFIPYSSEKVLKWLNSRSECPNKDWKPHYLCGEIILPEIEILFERLEK